MDEETQDEPHLPAYHGVTGETIHGAIQTCEEAAQIYLDLGDHASRSAVIHMMNDASERAVGYTKKYQEPTKTYYIESRHQKLTGWKVWEIPARGDWPGMEIKENF